MNNPDVASRPAFSLIAPLAVQQPVRNLVAELLRRMNELDVDQLAAVGIAFEQEHINRLAALNGYEDVAEYVEVTR